MKFLRTIGICSVDFEFCLAFKVSQVKYKSENHRNAEVFGLIVFDETWDGSELPGRKSQADISVKHQFPCPASPIDLGCIKLINAGFMTF